MNDIFETKKGKLIFIFRIFIPVLLLASIITNGIQSALYYDDYTFFNYISYFTIMTNFMVALWFFIASFYFIYPGKIQGNKVHLFYNSFSIRGALLLYGMVTSVVYWLFLFNTYKIPTIAGLISNIIMHSVPPLAILADILLVSSREKIKKRLPFLWIIFPLLYGIYTIIRGEIVHWYPYWFLNPEKLGSYQNLFFSILLFSAGYLILGIFIYFLFYLMNQKNQEGNVE